MDTTRLRLKLWVAGQIGLKIHCILIGDVQSKSVYFKTDLDRIRRYFFKYLVDRSTLDFSGYSWIRMFILENIKVG